MMLSLSNDVIAKWIHMDTSLLKNIMFVEILNTIQFSGFSLNRGTKAWVFYRGSATPRESLQGCYQIVVGYYFESFLFSRNKEEICQ